MNTITPTTKHHNIEKSSFIDIDLKSVESLALSRLIDEVRNEDMSLSRYDRTHNRHNR